MSDLVAVIQVVGPRIIKVDRLLDEAHPQRTRVEVEIAVSPPRDSGHVMDARHGHSLLQLNRYLLDSLAMSPYGLPLHPLVEPGGALTLGRAPPRGGGRFLNLAAQQIPALGQDGARCAHDAH